MLCSMQKSRVVDESDDEMSGVEDEEDEKGASEEEEKPEIIESDIELDESDIVDPDNDEPQQVRSTDIALILILTIVHVCCLPVK